MPDSRRPERKERNRRGRTSSPPASTSRRPRLLDEDQKRIYGYPIDPYDNGHPIIAAPDGIATKRLENFGEQLDIHLVHTRGLLWAGVHDRKPHAIGDADHVIGCYGVETRSEEAQVNRTIAGGGQWERLQCATRSGGGRPTARCCSRSRTAPDILPVDTPTSASNCSSLTFYFNYFHAVGPR
jgi:hypothetical protein